MEQVDNQICIIEDNMPVRKLLATLLKKSGYSIQEFGDGNSALAWLSNNQPVCVLVDILLPDQNGTEVLNSIRQLPYGKKVTIVAVTGLAHENDRLSLLQTGFDAYISKPVNTISFAKEIQEIITGKSQLN